LLEACPPKAILGDREEEMNWFDNQIGLITEEMEALSGTGEPLSDGFTHVNAQAITVTDGPDSSAESYYDQANSQDYFWAVAFELRLF
jgi:hypothetical protein